MPRIFVTRPIPDEGIQLLTEAFGAESITVSPDDRPITREELLQGVKGADAILPILTDTIDAEVMDAAGPQLKIIANYAVGYDNIDLDAATERKIPVSNTPRVLTETTADMAFLLLMAAARRFNESERYLRDGKWKSWGPQLLLGLDIHGKTLGIYGMGRIGRAMARRAHGFGMNVIYVDMVEEKARIERKLEVSFVDKPALLALSDFISIHCPLLPETRHAFGEQEFKLMKKTACLINTARGPVVDEAALAKALKTGEIFAAGLDVYENEPNPHPDLLQCENAILIPHLGSATQETRAKMAKIAAENIIARLNNQMPQTCLNPEIL